MPEFGPFGDRTPEEIEYLQNALETLGSSRRTKDQIGYFVDHRGGELDDEADDGDRMHHYVINDPRYEAAIKDEYETMLAAVEALAKYGMAQETTHVTRRTLEREASRLLIAANRISQSEITTADFMPDA